MPNTITLRDWRFETPVTPRVQGIEFGTAVTHRKALSPIKSSIRSADIGAGQRRELMIDMLLNVPNRRELLEPFSGVLYFGDTYVGQLPPVAFSI